MIGFLISVTLLLLCCAVAFLLACFDPIWGQKMSIKEGLKQLLEKEK